MRVLAIGDIHGCRGALDDILKWVQPTPDDLVITLGDYVDRGPDSRGVLNRLIELKQSGMNLICLRGNHEVMMVNARYGGRDDRKLWLEVGGVQALKSYGGTGRLEDIPREHWDFLRNNLLNYYETEHHIFVHATVHCDLDMDEQPDYMLHWEFLRDSMCHKSGKTVICGHTSQKSGVPKVVPGAVCIDTFAHGSGWLTCLDAINGRYWQTDMLGRRREGHIEYEED